MLPLGYTGKDVGAESILFGMMDANPDWGVDTIFSAKARSTATCTGRMLYIRGVNQVRYTNQRPRRCYLKDASGATHTNRCESVTWQKWPNLWSFARPHHKEPRQKLSDELFSHEWMAFQTHGRFKEAGLARPIDRINNDGEYNVIYMHAANVFDDQGLCAYDKDPALLADYKTANITNLPNGKPNWYAFVSRWRARFSNEFVKPLTDDPLSPEFKGAAYTEYQIQGTNLFMGDWNETKAINTPVRNGGKLRTYSTGDLYPWIQLRGSKGPYHKVCVSRVRHTVVDVTHELAFHRLAAANLAISNRDW